MPSVTGVRQAAGFAAPEEALAYPYTERERQKIEAISGSYIVGAPDTVRKGLRQLAERTRPEELMIVTNVGDPAARRYYEIVADIFSERSGP